MEVTKIVAIDPSLSNTAVAGGFDSEVEITCFKSKKLGDTLRDRFNRYRGLVSRILSQVAQYQPCEAILIEGYSYASKVNREILGEFGGLLREGLLSYGEVIEVPPMTLKKFCTGRGNCDKIAVATALSRRYGGEYKTSDEWDALGLYHVGLVAFGFERAETEYQSEVAEKINPIYGKTTFG